MRNYNITQEINGGNNLSEAPTYKQYDEGQTMTISLMDNGQPADLTGVSVISFFKLPNQSIEQRTCKVDGNQISLTLGGSLLLYAGYVEIEFKLYKDNTVTTTFTISYKVESSINTSANISGGGYVTNGKYAVLVIAGQSNAVGFDESPVNAIFDAQPHPRIKQLGFNDGNNLKIIPLGHCAESFQDMRVHYNTKSPDFKGTKGIHLPLAKRILKHIPEDYELLVIPAAYGGTGFTSGNVGQYDAKTMKPSGGGLKWSNTSPYFLALRDRLEHALKMNESNYCIGVVWCQGENDINSPANHFPAFQSMVNTFFSHFNAKYPDRIKGGVWGPNQWYIYETTYKWKANANINTIWSKYQTWSPNTYIPITTTNLDTNETGGESISKRTTQDFGTHFGNGAYERIVAPAVYQKMLDNNLF